jgi:hypothetical protein
MEEEIRHGRRDECMRDKSIRNKWMVKVWNMLRATEIIKHNYRLEVYAEICLLTVYTPMCGSNHKAEKNSERCTRRRVAQTPRLRRTVNGVHADVWLKPQGWEEQWTVYTPMCVSNPKDETNSEQCTRRCVAKPKAEKNSEQCTRRCPSQTPRLRRTVNSVHADVWLKPQGWDEQWTVYTSMSVSNPKAETNSEQCTRRCLSQTPRMRRTMNFLTGCCKKFKAMLLWELQSRISEELSEHIPPWRCRIYIFVSIFTIVGGSEGRCWLL